MSFINKLLLLTFLFPITLFANTNNVENSAGILVGYIDYTSSNQPSLENSSKAGYNFFIIGFADVQGETANLDPSTNAYAIKSQIQNAHTAGAKVLITVGGEVNTFNPSSSADPKVLAESIYNNIIKPYGFDGIDFDLESPADPTQVKGIITALKELKSDIIISGAPQASVWYKDNNGTVSFSPSYWGDLVNSGLFDYIMLQVYNQGGGVQVYLPSGSKLGPSDPGIYTALYDLYLSKGVIPSNTKLIMGAPSGPAAGTGLSDPTLITADINCLKTGKNCVTGLKLSTTYPNFPGIMTWSVGHDANDQPSNPYPFSKGMKPCVIDNQCHADMTNEATK